MPPLTCPSWVPRRVGQQSYDLAVVFANLMQPLRKPRDWDEYLKKYNGEEVTEDDELSNANGTLLNSVDNDAGLPVPLSRTRSGKRKAEDITKSESLLTKPESLSKTEAVPTALVASPESAAKARAQILTAFFGGSS